MGADEWAALRRVATLVARGAEPAEIFAAVADGIARLLRVGGTRVVRYESDGSATIVAAHGESAAGEEVVEAPIRVAGRPWGAVAAAHGGGRLRAGPRELLAGFADLAATAIASAEIRRELAASRARV